MHDSKLEFGITIFESFMRFFDLCFFVLTNYFVGSLESCTPFMCLPSVTTVVASLWPSWRRPSSQLQLSTAAGSSGPGLVGLSASIKFDLTRDPKSFPAKINSTLCIQSTNVYETEILIPKDNHDT